MCTRMNRSVSRTMPLIVMVLASLSLGSFKTAFSQDTTWTVQTLPFANGYLSDICFVDENRGWAVGFDQETEQAAIVHTTDGGEVWGMQQNPLNGVLGGVHFLDADTGYAVGQDWDWGRIALLRTTNGGQQWHTPGLPVIHGSLEDVIFVSARDGWAVGGEWTDDGWQTLILHTQDGSSWGRSNHPAHIGWLLSLYFHDSYHGWAVGFDDQNSVPIILNTNDGGESWVEQIHPISTGMFVDVFFISETAGWTAGISDTSAVVLKTNDGGLTWSAVGIFQGSFKPMIESELRQRRRSILSGGSSKTTSIYFINPIVGFAAVNTMDDSHSSASLYRTADGGSTYTEAVQPLDNAWIQTITSTESKVYGAGNLDSSPLVAMSDFTYGPQLASILIGPANVVMQVEEQQVFTATGKDQFGADYPISNPVWETSNGGILDPDGTMCTYTATEVGSFTITCREGDDGVHGTGLIQVYEPQLASILISPANVVMQVEEQQVFTATGKDQHESDYPISNPVWETSNGGILDPNGTVCTYTATEAGDFTVGCREFGTDIIGLADVHVYSCTLPGDVNMDGNVDILDVLATVNHILGEQLQHFNPACADCNKDGQINIIDVLGIVNVILGLGVCVP